MYLTFLVENPWTFQVELVGCFKDKTPHALPQRILSGRRNSNENLSYGNAFGYIDWQKLGDWVQKFAYACAVKTKEANHTYFGLQYWGKYVCIFNAS